MKKKIVSLGLSLALLLTGVTIVPAADVPAEDENVIIVDNQDAEKSGNWSSGSSRDGKYGSDYTVLKKDSTGDTWIKWTPDLPQSGDYKVYYIQPEGVTDSQSIASAAPFTIHHAFGEDVIEVDQRNEGGTWELLGEYTFTEDDSYIQLASTVEENNTMADAVMFEYVPENVIIDNTDAVKEGNWLTGSSRQLFWGGDYNVGTRNEEGTAWMEWTPELIKGGNYNVQILHPDGTPADARVASDAHYQITHAEGVEDLRISQVDKGSSWETIGTWHFNAGTEGKVKLITDFSAPANNVFADAVRFEYIGEEYEEPVEVIVDNTEASGDIGDDAWHASTWRPDYYGTDYLTTVADGTEKSVVYTPDLPQGGNYAVYYWGPEGEAAGVPYEIRHKEGLTAVKFDQAAAVQGQWNLIGIYPFDQGTAGSVTIKNEGSSTNIFADALRFELLDEKIGLDQMQWNGDWTERTEGGLSWKESAQQNASVTFDYTAKHTGYHAVDIAIPENVADLTSAVSVSCGDAGSTAVISRGESGVCRTAAFYLEEGQDYQITLTNSQGGTLALEHAAVCCTGYDLMYEDFNSALPMEGWSFSEDSNWTVQDGRLTGSAGEIHQLKNEWVNAQITAKMTVDSMQDGAEFGLILSGSNNTYVKLSYSPESGRFTLYDHQTGTLLGESDPIAIAEGKELIVSADFSYPELTVTAGNDVVMELEFARDGEVGFFVQNAVLSVSMLHVRSSSGPEMTSGEYKVNLDEPRQTIWGLGIEVQSDSIGSGNNGLPESPTSVPHDLVQSERDRLYNDMLKGFRYLRLAGGLYYRGTDEEGKHLQERWDTQDEELAELIEKSGIEGIDFEFWSPTPYFKNSDSYITTNEKNTLKCFDPEFTGDKQAFLQEFADTVKEDLQMLQKNGIPIVQFGLQNEAPHKVNTYSHCHYDAEPYYETMKVVIPTLKEAFPNLHVHADSWNGQYSEGSKLIIQDEELLDLIDAWTFHRIGYNSDNQISQAGYYNSNKGNDDIVVYNNEFEYFGSASDWNCINTAQSIMNWMTFENSPTWHWLHMLKPLGNSEASGFSLGFWRAPGDTEDRGNYDYIEEGHWDYNYQNWNSIRGFLKHMPWDSVRYDVTEDEVRTDQRIMSYKTPEGRLVIVLTNRAQDTAFTFNIDTGTDAVFRGYRYTPRGAEEIELAPLSGSTISPTLLPLSIEFWVQDADETMKMADGISLDAAELSVSEGGTEQLTATVTPDDAANKNVTWTSEDFTVASVDENGNVTGVSEGETKIIAMAVSGSGQFRAECTVKVGEEEPSEPVSKKTLEYFLNGAKGFVEDGTVSGLVESIQQMFADAIAKGEAVIADEDATREEVLDAAKDLMMAIHALDMKAADKTDLEMALELAEMIDLSKYVEAGQAEFLEAKEAAEGVLSDGDAMQAETDEAWNRLVEAMNALRLKADKSVLEDLISQTEDLDLTGYTEESVSVFRAALAAANDILADENLSVDDQAKVDEAAAALQAAADGLEKAQGGEAENPGGSNTGDAQKPGGSQSGNVGQTTGGNADGQENQKSSAAAGAVKTGDSTPMMAAVILLAAATGAVLFVTRKRTGR